MLKSKKILAVCIILLMIMSNCYALLNNIVYATQTTYNITFVHANAGNDNYQYGDNYSVVHWHYIQPGHDQNGNSVNEDIMLYARIQKYDKERAEWLNVEGIFKGNNSGNQIATFTSEAENINDEYRIVFDNFLNDYNILVNGNEITENDYVIEHPNNDDYSQVVLKQISNDMQISVDRKPEIFEKCIEFSQSNLKNNNTTSYTVNEGNVDVQIGKINNQTQSFEPIEIIDNSSVNQDT